MSHQPKCDLGEVTSMNPSIYEVNVSYRVTLVQKKKKKILVVCSQWNFRGMN